MHTGSRNLLLVEDNPADANLIMEYLDASLGGGGRDTIVHVPTLSEARAWLATGRADAVLLDLRLPDGFGIECVDALRSASGEVPIVVLTGLDDDELAYACLAAGAQDYLSKNHVHIDTLRRAIAYAIARTREQSERRRADELQVRLAGIVEASSDAIVSIGTDGRISSWNQGAESIFRRSRAEAVGVPVNEVLEEGTPWASTPDGPREITLIRDGIQVVLSVVAFGLSDPDGQLVGYAAIYRNVTRARALDRELRLRNEELMVRDRQMRDLTARLNAIREEERGRISRVVHDELGQLLTGLKMDLRWFARRFAAPTLDRDALERRLVEAERLADQTLETVQRVAIELRPSALDALGLAPAIRDEARRFEARSGIEVQVRVAPDFRTEPEVGTALFRIVQELLTNVARHAHARTVEIGLDQTPEAWTLSVEDDGVGLPPGGPRPGALGILGMRERVAPLAGTVELTSGSVGGALATVRVPRPGGAPTDEPHPHRG